MKRKRATVILDLVDENIMDRNGNNIAQELLSWFREDAFSVPWVKDVKGVTVKTE